jgi:hypothetical protein
VPKAAGGGGNRNSLQFIYKHKVKVECWQYPVLFLFNKTYQNSNVKIYKKVESIRDLKQKLNI